VITGIGTDICDISRIFSTIERFGDRFRKRIFTKIELETMHLKLALAPPDIRNLKEAAFLAKRFAAKEAVSKALGEGILFSSLKWTDIEIVNDLKGKPIVVLYGHALANLERLIEESHSKARIHISISDTKNIAQAMAVIEKIH
jgi:holo-[acyl-carrier protein] synthase